MNLCQVNLEELHQASTQLSGTAFPVWLYLRARAGAGLEAWPRQATIAGGLGKSERSIRAALRELMEEGWISQVGREGRAVRYRLHLPEGASTPRHLGGEQSARPDEGQGPDAPLDAGSEAPADPESLGHPQPGTWKESAAMGEKERQKPSGFLPSTRQESAGSPESTRRDSAGSPPATRQESSDLPEGSRQESSGSEDPTRQVSVTNPAGFGHAPYTEGTIEEQLEPGTRVPVGGARPDAAGGSAASAGSEADAADQEIIEKALAWLLEREWWLPDLRHNGSAVHRENSTRGLLTQYAQKWPAVGLRAWCAVAADPLFHGHFGDQPGQWLHGYLDGFARKGWRPITRTGKPHQLRSALVAGDVEGAKRALRVEMGYKAEQDHQRRKDAEVAGAAPPEPEEPPVDWRPAVEAKGSLLDVEGWLELEVPGNTEDAMRERDQRTLELAKRLVANRPDLDAPRVALAVLDFSRWAPDAAEPAALAKWLEAEAMRLDSAAELLPEQLRDALLAGDGTAAVAAVELQSTEE